MFNTGSISYLYCYNEQNFDLTKCTNFITLFKCVTFTRIKITFVVGPFSIPTDIENLVNSCRTSSKN